MTYGFLAPSYDGLTRDVDYEALCDRLERRFLKAARCPVRTVLDLACGTGSLTWLLARRGYETIGVDLSAEMLAQAREKGEADFSGTPPLFLNQSMDKLDLYGTIDACVCCLDSVNYVTRPAALRRAFERVHTFLMPGGVFLFDARTPEALAAMDGQMFLDEDEDTYCVWQGEFSPKRRLCTYYMDIFRRENGLWRRGQEEHQEYAYTVSELTGMLEAAGFSYIKCYGAGTSRPPKPGADRVDFLCRKKGTSHG